MLKTFNLMYYVPGMTPDFIFDLDRVDAEHYYKLLKAVKAREADPPKKE
jgi:hypothetical protein